MEVPRLVQRRKRDESTGVPIYRIVWVRGLNLMLGLLLGTQGLLQIDAASPELKHFVPAAVAPGNGTPVVFSGENLTEDAWVWTSHPGIIAHRLTAETAGSVRADFSVSASTPEGIALVRWVSPQGISEPRLLLVDRLKSILSSGTNTTSASAQLIDGPTAVDGRMASTRSHWFRVAVRRGQRLQIETMAARLGSSLDPVLRLLDMNGRELAYSEDDPALGVDARIQHTAARAGSLLVELRDTRHQGGPDYFYRLRFDSGVPVQWNLLADALPGAPGTDVSVVREIEPNDTPVTANTISVPAKIEGSFQAAFDRDCYQLRLERGTTLSITARTRSEGFDCDVLIQLLDGSGRIGAESNPTGADDGALTAAIKEEGLYTLQVEELNHRAGPESRYELAVELKRPGFDLNVEADQFTAPPGGAIKVKLNVVRRDYPGPVRLELHPPLAEIEIVDPLIPAGTNSVEVLLRVLDISTASSLLHARFVGRAEINGSPVDSAGQTTPLWKKRFPQWKYVPRELRGLLTFGVTKAAAKEETRPGE